MLWMQVGVRSMHGFVKTKTVYILPVVPIVQSLSTFQNYNPH